MLIIRCSGCKSKLFRYDKIGKGEVLRCHKDRIKKTYCYEQTEYRLLCCCGKEIGIDKGRFFKMDRKAFTYSGTKRN